jgi:HK97 family phage portal protein
MRWGIFGRKSVTTVTLERLASIGGFLRYGSGPGGPVNAPSALQVAAVWCAARVIAEGVAQTGKRVVRIAHDGTKKSTNVERDHPVMRLLAERPNAWQTPFEFCEMAVFSAVLGQGFLARKVRDSDGITRELLPVPLGEWTVKRGKDWAPEFEVTSGGQLAPLPRRDAFYLRGPSLDGVIGLAAIQVAREAIGLSAALERTQAKLAANGGKPSGILSFANLLNPDAKEELRSKWQDKFGPDGDGGIAVLDGDASYSSITMTSVDAQHIETRRHQIEEVARVFRVHPIMLMHPDMASSFASAEQFFRAHVVHTLGPWMQRFEEAATRDLLGERGLRVDCDERDLLRGDFKDQAEYYSQALGAGGTPAWMTPNEVRAERGMNPAADAFADELPRGGYAGDTAPASEGGDT